MDLAGQLADAGCDAFYFTGFSLDQRRGRDVYDIANRAIQQQDWLARARKYGVIE
jgi:hypothetical protein